MVKTKHIVDLKKDWPIALLVVGAIIAVGFYSGAFRGICTKIPIPLLCMSSEEKARELAEYEQSKNDAMYGTHY